MKTTVAILAFGLMVFLLTAGHSNAIYFDMESQSVVGCDGTIKNLYIIGKENEDFFYFSVLPDKKSVQTFSLKKINENYSIETRTVFITLQNFKLRPETEYEITNSYGDRPDGELIIRTDKNGSVIYADKTSCK